MSYYEYDFAAVYDDFTEDVDYGSRADYICKLLSSNGINDGILLDVACGTGSFLEFYRSAGFEIVAVDNSEAMLSLARDKFKEDDDIVFLCQDMRELDLYGTVDCAVCSLDSINHLTSQEDVLSAFKSIALFVRQNGIFVFDANSIYKHKEVLGNNSFVFENENHYLVWQNFYDESTDTVDLMIDIFSMIKDDTYVRGWEEFSERAYAPELLIELLDKAGFDVISVFGDMNFECPTETEERLYFTARKR